MVDTCGGEFEAKTPYFYSIQNGTENEALPFIQKSGKPRIVVLGSGPIRIGQGIEFDYACVHCVWTLKSIPHVNDCAVELHRYDLFAIRRKDYRPPALQPVAANFSLYSL